jgi:transposase
LRAKIPELSASLAGRFTEHHAFLVATHLRLIDQHDEAIASVTARIEQQMIPFLPARELIVSIPGIAVPTADVVIAETGADMSRFPTPGHLASWAGVCPGHNESAGKSRSTKARPCNRHLKGALGASAMSIAAQKNTFLAVKYLAWPAAAVSRKLSSRSNGPC